MNYEFGFVCMLVSFIGSGIGTIIIQKIVQKTGRSSMLIFVLFGVLLISTILIPVQTIGNLINQLSEGADIWAFEAPC